MGGTTVLAGIDVNGAVWVKPSDRSWQNTGRVDGQADAFTVSDGTASVLLAYDTRGVVVSTDQGANWRVVVERADGS